MEEKEIYDRLRNLEEDCVLFAEQIKTMKEVYMQLTIDIKSIKEKLLNRLPAWGTIMITTLCSLCVGLIVYSLK